MTPYLHCPCHQDSHATGTPSQRDLLAVVAARENELQDDIEKSVYVVRALPRDPSPRVVDATLARFEANVAVGRLVRRILAEREDVT